MNHVRMGLAVLLGVCLLQAMPAADAPTKRNPKEALKEFNSLIGSWRGTGEPEGTRQEKQRGFWVESQNWEWQFKGDDAWLKVDIDKGKYFARGELRYLPDKDLYRLTLVTPDKEELAFDGPLKDGKLTLERADEKKKEAQRIVVTLLHANRFLYRYEVKPENRSDFSRVWQVGVTKEGVAFAGAGDNQPECVVSGGLGKIPVTYKGQTYYVCCTGCRDAFKDDPEKYIKEYQERKANEAKEKKDK
jgi:YHS domain